MPGSLSCAAPPLSARPASTLAALRPRPLATAGFRDISAATRNAPLVEIAPLAAGDEGAALGFALAWIAAAADGLIIWAGSQASFSEDGLPCAEGLAQYGVALDRLFVARGRTQTDALWVAEQALTVPGAHVLCTIAPSKKPLGLTATRRLLLASEKSGAHCILLRLDKLDASAAWARWRISAAPSEGVGRELGAPAFMSRLERNRAGPAGQSWRLVWTASERVLHEHASPQRPSPEMGVPERAVPERAVPERALFERATPDEVLRQRSFHGRALHEHVFNDDASAAAEAALDGDLAAASFDRSVETRRRSAV